MTKDDIFKVVRTHMADCVGISERDIDDHGERIAFNLYRKINSEHCRKAEEEMRDAYDAASWYVREDGFITPRQALARQACEIERLKNQIQKLTESNAS